MLRSFVLTISTVTNRVWGVVWGPQLATTFGGDEAYLTAMISGLTAWLGWVIPLLIAQWWLDRHPSGARRDRRVRRSA
ncbi:hypothetical protein MOQ72_03915 [Saccharopolyspora sp. K220]|uniref:hypothetical protein n=1 Tax=Saccharopolyspora soli TaxID=2926618 RepID=UPI001F5A4D93|nr:hypothetical protein [Saccharopolyspora soli]MCI2416559.1 hypothetical protein [Saccharopolyspora soli]